MPTIRPAPELLIPWAISRTNRCCFSACTPPAGVRRLTRRSAITTSKSSWCCDAHWNPPLLRWPISDDLTVDLDGPCVIFRHGSSASIDSDYDLGVLPEAAIRRLKITELGAALLAIDERDDDEWPVDGWLIDTDPPNRI